MKKTYKVIITETLTKTIHVDAENAQQARQFIKDKYTEADDACVLHSDDFDDVNFKTQIFTSDDEEFKERVDHFDACENKKLREAI